MKKFTVTALMICSLFAVSSCDKMDVTPSVSTNSTTQEARDKTRGVETQVSGVVEGVTFTATLRVESFYTSGGQVFAIATLERVKGVRKAVGDALEGAEFTYNVQTLTYTCSEVSWLLSPFKNSANLGNTLNLSPVVVIVDSSSPRYDLLGSTLCDIQTEIAGLSQPGATLDKVVSLFNTVATTIGRY